MKKRFQDIKMSTCKAATRLGFTMQESDEALTIFVHDVIGDFMDGLDSQSLVTQIAAASDRQIILNINSPGGSVFDAISIYTALAEHGDVRADITGMAASAATILASAADTIRIATAGTFMIHRAWTIALGNASEMEALAKTLRLIDREIADLLSARSGTSVEEIVQLMDGVDGADGTTFSGKEAVEHGFADELIPLKTKPTPENEPEQDTVKRSYIDMVVAHRRRAA